MSAPTDPVTAKGYMSCTLTAEELVERAVRNAGHGGDHPLPRWSWVRSIFGLGSTSGAELCRRFDLDPDEMLGEHEECPACGGDGCEDCT